MCQVCGHDHNVIHTNAQGEQYQYVVNNGRLMTSDGKPYWFYAHNERITTPVTNKRRTVTEDPTRQAGNRRRAIAELRRRLRGAQDEVLKMFNDIPTRTVTVNKERYIYELSADRVNGIDAFIREIVTRWFDTQSDTHPARWFFDPYIETPVRQATADSANRTAMLAGQAGYSTAVLTQFEVSSILMSEPYRRRVELLLGRTFNEMKGFTGQTATDLARVLADTVALGRSPREAQRLIRERFSVANSRAERIARTEINNAYTTARLEEQQRARDIGVDVRVVHRSALIPTTRPWHASRHGRVYTIEEQQEFWARRGNSINCLCSVSEVVYDTEGKPYDQGLLKRLRKQRLAWAGE